MLYQLRLAPLSWDSAVAVGLFLIAAAFGGLLWWRQKTDPGRTFQLQFDGHPNYKQLGALPTKATKKFEDSFTDRENVIINALVIARRPVPLSSFSFRLVERRLRPHLWGTWRWRKAPSTAAFVAEAKDMEWERTKGHPTAAPAPTSSRLNPVGGHTVSYLSESHRLRSGDRMWYQLRINLMQNWEGYLELEGETKDGRPAYTHRSVKIARLASRSEERPPESAP